MCVKYFDWLFWYTVKTAILAHNNVYFLHVRVFDFQFVHFQNLHFQSTFCDTLSSSLSDSTHRNQPTVTGDIVNPTVAAATAASVVNSTEWVEVASQSATSKRYRSLPRLRRATTSIWMKSRGFGRRDEHEIHDQSKAEQRRLRPALTDNYVRIATTLSYLHCSDWRRQLAVDMTAQQTR